MTPPPFTHNLSYVILRVIVLPDPYFCTNSNMSNSPLKSCANKKIPFPYVCECVRFFLFQSPLQGMNEVGGGVMGSSRCRAVLFSYSAPDPLHFPSPTLTSLNRYNIVYARNVSFRLFNTKPLYLEAVRLCS